MLAFKIIAAVGLLLITVGIINKRRHTQNIMYILGGSCLEIYSLYLQDPIFIVLQILFIFSAVYDLFKSRSVKK